MRNAILVLLAAIAAFSTGCFEKPRPATLSTPLLRSHFIGMTQLIQSSNAPKVREVWALPASADLRRKALDKIAKTPFQLAQKVLPAGAVDQPTLIRPLLDDLLASESYIELKSPEAGSDSVIAVQLDEQRARVWDTNLWQLVAAWKLNKPQPLSGGISGWESRGAGITFQFQRRGKWVLAGWSLGKLAGLNSLASAFGKSDRPVPPAKSIIELQADLPALGRWSPILAKYKLAPVDLTITPRGEYIRTEAQLSLSEPLTWKFEPWRIPTNIISDPLTSFSVAQRVDPLLKALPGFDELGLKHPPSQACAWGQKQTFNSFWTFPMENASNVLPRIAAKAPAFVKSYLEQPVGTMTYITNRSEMVWTGLPLAVPVLRSVTSGSQDYLLLGLLPPSNRIFPPPPELFSQIGNRSNLMYYDWEITQFRLEQARQLYQVIDMAHLRLLGSTNDPSFKWVDQTAALLGNTITEISMTSPKQLQFVRKSHIGFTGFELATMLRWIDSPAFPLGYEPPASPRRKPAPTPSQPKSK